MMKKLLVPAFLCFGVVQCYSQGKPTLPPPPAGVEMVQDVEIGQGGGRALHAIIAYPNGKATAAMPAVLLIHGGGWIQGSPAEFLPAAYALAQRGYFAACPEYRLSDEAKWPAQIEDCKLAVRWVRANASKYHVNPEKIGCWGDSAGGHLVACLGTMDDPKLDGTGGYSGVSSKVEAVSDWCGPTDFTDGSFGNGSETVTATMKQFDVGLLNGLFGATFAQKPEVYKEASPLLWVKAGDPPFLVVNGDHDEIVATVQGIKIYDALRKAGVPAQLIIVKYGGHGMGSPPDEPAASPSMVELLNAVFGFFDKWLK